MNASSSNVHIRVLAASTGVCYPITLPFNELTIQNIQRHLAAVIPKDDQILLLGPPYKVPKDHTLRSSETLASLQIGDVEDDPTKLDTSAPPPLPSSSSLTDNNRTNIRRKPILGTTEKTGSRRLFLFSKRALSDSAPDPVPCTLSPMDVHVPDVPDPSPIVYNNSSSSEPPPPLHVALSMYERSFMLHLCQGRAYADAADLRLEACRNCILEQEVMVRALRAAVSNLSDHWNNATRTRADFTTLYLEKSDEHGKILNGLDGVLEDLSKIPLHKELKTIARMNGRVMETLMDTVPVEREKRWAGQCQTSYSRLQGLYEELKVEFDNLVSSSNREEESKSDLESEELVKALDDEVEQIMVGLRNEQANRLNRLTNDHIEVVNVVLNAVQDGTKIQAAFDTLESMSKASSNILPSMQEDDLKLKSIMIKVAEAKTSAMKRMNVRLRQISLAQLKIQRLLKGVSGLRAALVQQCEDMTHLEHVFELTSAYRSFVSEIKRRRSYGEAVTAIANAMFDRLAKMRNDEVKSRERFLRGPGRHLMPSFFDIFVPTLATQPPLFAAQLPGMVEIDSLPNFSDEENSFSSNTPVQRNISSGQEERNDASSLTDSVPQTDNDDNEIMGSMSRLCVGSKDDTFPDKPLVVCAEGQSGEDITMNSENDVNRMDQLAENKTLAYENAVLRQAVQELSGKSPQAYIDVATTNLNDSNQKDVGQSLSIQEEINLMKKELESTRTQLEKANAALAEIKSDDDVGKLCDKISHSSFQVGDVALFMPTGKKVSGRKTYLAFHSNCPHRYLSTDNIESNPDYVLGRIIHQEELIAGALGTDKNPHGLRVGTKFWILTVEVLKGH
eukprot:CAMPEP_0176503220 /NCGR_PEP_ID=MMETSP0200_2-20121128/15243_1 /TAXON_ID=947934 /ORGANISM="Chaetoceros sp., Strain GSL56" /LENGTH=844 /DNA_ID=CAMNT_0017902489 /DNA_START=274 /DNA_END=2808 /DNA_ORIENTATION=-